jgi:hypothetical protein
MDCRLLECLFMVAALCSEFGVLQEMKTQNNKPQIDKK